jgi:signal transduction histidine kinase
LVGRDVECAELSNLLDAARTSRSAALVLRGEPGVGKTALLGEAQAQASGMQVLSARGVESEAELPFAGLHQLLRPALSLIDRLPSPQAAALRGALGLAERAGDDRFLIAVACLTLLSELTEQRPVLCLIDDSQWLDASSADALLFVARRLDAEGIVILFALRTGEAHRFDARGVPELEVPVLGREAADALITRRAEGAVAPAVRRMLVEQSGGNALALVELPKALSDVQLAGTEPLPRSLPLTPDIERLFLERVRRLPDPAQQVLRFVAAEDSGSLEAVMRASHTAGIDGDSLRAAERAGLVSMRDARIDVRHPLVRSAILQDLSADEYRATHLALAGALDDDTNFDERTWHLAAAAIGPDAEIADALEEVAERARRRSAHAPSSAALERAAELSLGRESKGRRLALAAVAAWHAGQPDRATALRDRADPLVDDPLLRADIVQLRGQIQLRCGVLLDACDILVAGAEDVAPLDTRKALAMLIEAREAAGWAGDNPRSADTGHRAAALPPSDDPTTRFLADLLVGVGKLYEGEAAAALPLVRDVVARADDFDEPSWVTWAATGAQGLGDEDRASELIQRAIALARESGAVDKLTYALLTYVLMGLFAGRLGVATEAAEGLALAREAGLANAQSKHLAMLAWFAAVRGDEAECRTSAQAALELAEASRGAFANAIAQWGLGLLAISRQRGADATAHLERVRDPAPGVGHPYFALLSAPDLVEGCVLAGRTEAAGEAFAVFEGFAQAGGPPWALALAARCRALLADDGEPDFAEALRLHAESDRPLDHARTLLLLGEQRWQHGRRSDAPEPLRAALERFKQLGAAGWADRAREALRAAGEETADGAENLLSRLAPEELQMARLVADGHSNREVAARLFRSPRTVGAQLRRVYAKLGVSSRVELSELGLGTEPPTPLLRSRLARAGLAELFRELRTIRGGELAEALARTVGDPELLVAHRLPDGRYASADGTPESLPPATGDRAIAPVEIGGREVAAIVYDADLEDDGELVDALCAAAGIVIENENLHQESETRLTELQTSRQRIVAAGDAERRRLERNLHDGAQQRLVALAMQLRLAQSHIRDDPAAAEALVTSASDELARSLAELRDLARGLHPATLEHGLGTALESLASRSTVPTAVTCDVGENMPRPVELALFFVACEALANVGKYANATAASIRAWQTGDGVAIEIADDGLGGADSAAGSGLRGLSDRVEALDGLLLVTSPPGAGTVVTAEIPCAAVRS